MTISLLCDLADEFSNSKYSILDGEFLLASNNPKKRAGRKKFCETRHPIYRGVRRRNSGKWVCEMREPNKKSRIWLGTYPTVEMAARAHDVAAIALRGRLACLNFADSSWRLPIPVSREIKDIQKAAAEAAQAFRPSKKVDQVDPLMEVDPSSSTEDVNVDQEEVYSQEEVVPSPEEVVLFSTEDNIFSPEVNVFSSEDNNVFLMDEEDIYSVPWLISSMAEGLMLAPPLQSRDEEPQEHHHIQLWSFST